MARPTPEQLAKINQLSKVPLTEDQVYVHKYRLIGTKLMTNRFLKIDQSLLPVYLRNVTDGDVGQIIDHSLHSLTAVTLPFGRSFAGEIVNDGMDSHLDGWIYMVAGVPTYVEPFTTDDINQQIDAGILHDSSVTINWGFSQCSICGNNYRDYDMCRHYAGKVYVIDGVSQLCYVIAKPAPPPLIDNSYMLENSIVVAGAYPDAGVLATQMASKPETDKPARKQLNSLIDLKLANPNAPVFCSLSSTSAIFYVEGESVRDAGELHQMYHSMYQNESMEKHGQDIKLTQKHKDVVKALLDTGGEHFMIDALDGTLPGTLKDKSKKGERIVTNEAISVQLDVLKTQLTEKEAALNAKDSQIAALQAELEELKAKADLGEQYRQNVIADALAAGIRDQGNDFPEETYAKMFESLSIEEIKELSRKWEESAMDKLGLPHTKEEEFSLPDEQLSKTKDDESTYSMKNIMKGARR